MALQIGRVLTQLLATRRLTVREVSQATGVPSSTLVEWKTNRSPRNPDQVRQVARFLGVSLHFLLFGEEDPEEPLQKILMEDLFSGTFEITLKRVQIK